MRFTSNLALISALLFYVQAAPSSIQDELWKRASGSVTTSVKTTIAQQYDYIIVGAGLTGLTVANRLSEDPNVSVLVIEAGKDTRNDQEVYSVAAYGQGRNDGVHDFAYETETIPITGNTKTISAGKGLGGSTSINGAAVTGPDALQFDDFGKLNSGWSFSEWQKYWKKAETFTTPNSAQKAAGASYDASAHGTSGPVNVAFTSIRSNNNRRDYDDSPLEPRFYTGPYQKAFMSAAGSAIGLKTGSDLLSGHTNMVATTPNTINVAAGGDGQTRVSSATAYLSPIENSRPNLRVLTTYTVTHINWDANTKGKAVGVQVKRTKDGNAYDVVAKKEVLVAAGSIGTPMLLEASGVGDPAILKKIGVSQQINLPGVGKNLIEQTMNSLGAAADIDTSGGGPSSCIAGPGIANLFPDNSTAVLDKLQSSIQSYADQAVAAGAAVNSAGLMKIYNLMVGQIKNGVAVSELFADTGYPDGYGIDSWTLTVFSRGYAHASSSSVFDPPALNPRYFAAEIDMQFQVATLRAARKILQQDSVKSLTKNGETVPGFSTIPDGTQHGRYSRWQDWIVGKTGGGFASVAHPIGTCSMMAQADGGCVDPNFLVYGSSNVRVIDASILPMQFSQHLSTSLYGIAEKAGDIIKASK